MTISVRIFEPEPRRGPLPMKKIIPFVLILSGCASYGPENSQNYNPDYVPPTPAPHWGGGRPELRGFNSIPYGPTGGTGGPVGYETYRISVWPEPPVTVRVRKIR